MKKTAAAAAAVIILIFSAGLLHAERISLVTDQYWYEMILKENSHNPVLSMRQSILELIPFLSNTDIFVGRKKIKTAVIGVTGQSADYQLVFDAVSRVKNGAVILSPMLAFEAVRLAEAYPELRIIALGGLPEGVSLPGNCIFLELSRIEAFSAAGQWAAGQGAQIFPLFFTGTDSAENEMKAFKAAWQQGGEAGSAEIIELSDSKDTAAVDRWVGKVEKADGCIAAVFAGPLTMTALDRLDGISCKIITEHTALWPESGYSEAASIELTPVKILTEVINYSSTASYGDNEVIKAEFIRPEF